MNFFENYPRTDFHELNLDWIISKVKELIAEWDTTKTAWNELHDYVMNYFANLDVDQEISDKLDQMARDGSLSELIYDVIGNSAYPKFVSSVDDMTNTQAIYVLSSSGELYYYNGSTFVASGINYGMGNGALSCYNHLINQASYEELNFFTFDECEKNKIYAYGGGSEEYVRGLPDYRYDGILIDFAYNQTSDTGRLQIFSNSYQSWFRINWNNKWSGWFSNSPSSEIYITSENYEVYNDIYDLPTNNCYAIASSVTSEMVANLPEYGKNMILYKVNMDSNESSDFSGEIILCITESKMYFKQHYGTSYTPWISLDSVYPHTIGAGNNYYGYTDYNEFTTGTYVIFDSSNTLNNRPQSSVAGTLVCYDNSAGGIQILFLNALSTSQNDRIYLRHKWQNSWGAWKSMKPNGYNLWGNGAIASNNLPNDLNEFSNTAIYAIASTITEDYLANLPSYGEAGMLIVTGWSDIVPNGIIQAFITDKNDVWFRMLYNNIWHDWVGVTESGMNYFINTCIDKPFGLSANSKILAFGDSITAGYNVGVNNAWVKFVADKLGCQLENKAVSGATFNETRSNNIKSQYESVSDWNTITHVFIAGGINDASTSTPIADFKTYVQNTIDYIRARTNAPILFITPIERIATIYNSIHYASIINSIALANDCSVINGYDVPIPFRQTEWYNNMTSDGLHPNIQGQKVYARYVLTCLL